MSNCCGNCGHAIRASVRNMEGFLWCNINVGSVGGCSKEANFLSPNHPACISWVVRTTPLPPPPESEPLLPPSLAPESQPASELEPPITAFPNRGDFFPADVFL